MPTLPRLALLLPLLAVACAPEGPRVPTTIGVGRVIEDGEPLPEGAVTLEPHPALARLGRGTLRVVPRELEVERVRVRGRSGGRLLDLQLTPASTEVLAEVSAQAVERQIALFVDRTYFSDPEVESPLVGLRSLPAALLEFEDDEVDALLDRLDP